MCNPFPFACIRVIRGLPFACIRVIRGLPFASLRVIRGLCLAWLIAVPAAMAASPRLDLILPRGVQRGAQHVLTFSGSHLSDAQEILFYTPGLEVAKLEPDGDGVVRVTLNVAPDCRLGEHVAQVRTASGISDYRTFYVGALPAVAEQEPNSDFAAPQLISLNVTVEGIAQNEDVDYYAVEAKKGQRLCAEVEGMRLGSSLLDPYVAILDSRRFELAAADETPLLLQDGFAGVIAPEDGKYTIEVRESAYGGNDGCRYRLHVGTFPRPTAVYPAGGKLGEVIEVRYLGDAAGELVEKIELPSQPQAEFGLYAHDAGGIAPSPNPFRLFEQGNVLEVEPNDAPANATAAELPLAMNGIIGAPGDVDFFRFQAAKGQVYEVECYARRVRSALDPVMYLYNASSTSLAGSDDSRGPDSYFRFGVPEDGQYTISVTDHLGRGGADYVYRIELVPVKPLLKLGIPRVERYGQYRQTIVVPRGNRFGTLITAERADFGGDLLLEGTRLPDGVTMIAEAMPANSNVMPVVFQAAADAPIAGRLVDFNARHADPQTGIRGAFWNRADLVLGEPNQSVYRFADVNRLAVAVVEELPFELEIVEPKVPLVRDGSMNLKIVARRREGFVAPIQVELPFRPPGVGAASSVTMPEGQSEVFYPLSANGGAEIKKWKIFALGSADVRGAAWVSSQLAVLDVAGPYVTLSAERAACEQGQEAQVYCKLNQLTPFDGTAKVQLLGLPPKTSTPELEFTKDTKELIFKVATDAASPAGQHNMICQVTIVQQGEPVTSYAGGAQLQIDTPLPAPVAAAAPAAAPPPETANQPPAKPPSRLEKLRMEAKQRAEERAKRLAQEKTTES